MATKTVYATGIIEWAKLFEPDDYNGVKAWKCAFTPNEASKEAIKEAGVRLKWKDGEYGKFISPKRPVSKKGSEGEEYMLEPPEVMDASGKEWDPSVSIGNGSTVTIKLSVYDTRMGKGHTLEAVRVDNHVPFVADGDFKQDNSDLANLPPIGSSSSLDEDIPF